MTQADALKVAVDLLGLRRTAMVCERSYQAVQQWRDRGALPRTEYTGETDYAARIAAACREMDPSTQISRESLLGLHPSAARLERRTANA